MPSDHLIMFAMRGDPALARQLCAEAVVGMLVNGDRRVAELSTSTIAKAIETCRMVAP